MSIEQELQPKSGEAIGDEDNTSQVFFFLVKLKDKSRMICLEENFCETPVMSDVQTELLL